MHVTGSGAPCSAGQYKVQGALGLQPLHRATERKGILMHHTRALYLRFTTSCTDAGLQPLHRAAECKVLEQLQDAVLGRAVQEARGADVDLPRGS